ncbi:hypothetical protein [Cyanobacterium aponinum]|uniref:hypothetical protein n=1 Tax=Cyanobacterium aponinum TaxID=379064 RepID=UPI0019D44324|nr:hypothetical protein [Cyanobacterium aponinum]
MHPPNCHPDVRKDLAKKHPSEIPRQARNDNAFNCHADARKHLSEIPRQARNDINQRCK